MSWYERFGDLLAFMTFYICDGTQIWAAKLLLPSLSLVIPLDLFLGDSLDRKFETVIYTKDNENLEMLMFVHH